MDGADAGQAAVRRRLDRPDEPDAVDFAGRQQPGAPRVDLRRGEGRVQGADRAGSIDGGCDLLLARNDLRHAERQGGARRRIDEASATRTVERAECHEDRLPLMISVTVTDRSGRTLSGQTIDAFWASVAARAAVQRRHQLRARRARHAAVPGRARRAGRLLRQLLSERRAAQRLRPVRRAAASDRGTSPRIRARSGFVNIVGGCCGTTPDHIAAIAKAVERLPPRTISDSRFPISDFKTVHAASPGLETLTIRPDSQLPDDRRADQRHRLGAVRAARSRAGDYAAAAQVALDQVRGGANLIDVNMDEGMLDSEARDDRRS